MVNIINPKYTSKDLKKFRETAMNQIGEKKLRKLSRINALYNALAAFLLLAIALCFMTLAIKVFFTGALGVLLFICSASFGLFFFSYIGDLWNGTINPKTFSQFTKNGCEHPHVLEKDFLKVILETERIEAFCDIIKNHPDCILQETDNWDIKVEYVENNFKKTKTFSSSLDLYCGRIVKDFVLDFSYLDKCADKYLNNSND